MKTARDLCFVAVAMAAFVLLAEFSLRFAGIRYESSLYRLDADLGYVLRADAAGWSVKERDNFERISAQGLRDRMHSPQRAADTIRIAVVGDSFSEAKQVDIDQAWWSVMERKLNSLMPSGRRVEVVNFGVAGYGLPQEYLVIKQKIWKFDPQIVLLTGNLHSLILGCSRKYSSVQVAGGPTPYFVRSNEGMILDAQSQRQHDAFVPPGRLTDFISDLSNDSQVLSLLNALRRALNADLAYLRHHSDGTGKDAAASELSYEDKVLRGPGDAQFSEAWQRAEDLIMLSNNEVTRHHGEFWVVLLDMSPQVDPDLHNREALRRALDIDNLFVSDRAFDEFATRQDIHHVLTAADLLNVAEQKHILLHGFPARPRNSGHWNESGHEAAGELLARRLFDSSPRLKAP